MSIRKNGILVAVLLTLSGCSWRGELSADSYMPSLSSEKENLTIGLFNIDRPKPVKYGQSVDYQLDLSNYVLILQKELESHFERVKIIQAPGECPECQMFVRSRLVFQVTQQANAYRGALRVDFLSRNQKLVTSVGSQTQGDVSPDGALMTKTVVNQLALGLLSASTIEDYGELITNATEQGIGDMLSDIGYQIDANPMLTGRAVAAQDDLSKSKPLPVAKEYKEFVSAVVELTTPNAQGSGFVISGDGKILTNAHVVQNWDQVLVKHFNGRVTFGKVIRSDEFRDLAVVQTDKIFCSPLTLGSEEEIEVGTEVFAVGAPKGLEFTVTDGIISQARNIEGVRMLQTNTAISSGSSGGPLIQKSTGHVIGVNARSRMDEHTGAQIQGFNFAVSVDEVKAFLEE